MGLSDGYVGISKEPKARWQNHKRGKEGYPVQKAIAKHGSKLTYTILDSFDNKEDACWLEFTLRPYPNIGWNLAAGGSLPPDSRGENNPNFGKSPSEETRRKMSAARQGNPAFSGKNHPRSKLADIFDFHTHEKIASDVVIRVWALANGFKQGHLSATARGELKQHKGVYARYI